MTINFIIAQIIVILALIILMLSFQRNEKKLLLKYFNKYNKKVPIYCLIIIVILMIIFSLITYIGIISLLPMFAVVLYSIAVWYGNLKLIRCTEVISCTLFIVYNIRVLAITGLIATIIELIAALIAIYRFDIKN